MSYIPIKKILANQGNLDNWLQLKPSAVADLFYNQDATRPRILGCSFKINDSNFTDWITNISDNRGTNNGNNGKGTSLTLFFELGVDSNGDFSPALSLRKDPNDDNNNVSTCTFQGVITEDVVTSSIDSVKGMPGVSARYKNEACLNWLRLPDYKIADSFNYYPPVDLSSQIKPKEKDLSFGYGPHRIKAFLIPGGDLLGMKYVLGKKWDSNYSSLVLEILFGYNSGEKGLGNIPFTPIVHLGVPTSDIDSKLTTTDLTIQNDADESHNTENAYFDFVHACPPSCGGGDDPQ